MSERFFPFAIMLAICGAVAFGTNDVPDHSQQFTFVVPDFRGVKFPQDRNRILGLARTHQQLVLHLMTELRESEDPNQKAYIVQVLGSFHATEATDQLVEIIDLKSPDTEGQIRALWGDYPAVEALVTFHAYGIGSILRALPTEAKPLRRRLMFDVIEQVEGPKIGRMVFDRRIEQIQKDNQRKPLKDYVPFLEEIKALQAAKAEFEKQFPLPPP